MPDGKLGSAACLASSSLDIDNEPGRPLFQESQKFGTNARLGAQPYLCPTFVSSEVSLAGPNYARRFPSSLTCLRTPPDATYEGPRQGDTGVCPCWAVCFS